MGDPLQTTKDSVKSKKVAKGRGCGGEGATGGATDKKGGLLW